MRSLRDRCGRRLPGLVLALVGAAFGSGIAGASAAAPAGDLRVLQPTATATPAGATTALVHLTLHNVGASADRLVGASTPLAAKVEIHSMTMNGMVMKMRPVAGVDVPSGGEVEFVTGGMHLMLEGLSQPLRQGQSFPLTLKFQHAGDITVQVAVAALGARQDAAHPPAP
ncbi:MAG TPA: copper chaperone PCu(A)C [Steroidobacteraceae bacterium]|nr:copper chaperone PCu(A)C [Steroidobacteraceae bacterium]